jgi:hypothetical protein
MKIRRFNLEASHTVHFRIVIIRLIVQLNAHIQLNICIVY